MAASPDTVSMAMFCDFENVALGVRDAKYEKFDIKPVLERLLLKGSIVLKKAYCDWDRYKSFKATMHEANFELIEIPHVRQSGKNSADIRMVVDALDLCYTKSHVNTFVIVSGDSDFSPLVSKLRENAKYVIGVGVKQSTSDLLIANCDEFIFYDDLVREVQHSAARRDPKSVQPSPKRTPEEDRKRREEVEARKSQAVELAVATFEALVAERGDSGKIWASMLKEAIKRRKPDFNETYYGFRAFGNLLEEAQSRGLLELGRDEKSGAYVSRSSVQAPRSEAVLPDLAAPALPVLAVSGVSEEPVTAIAPKRRGRGGSGGSKRPVKARSSVQAARSEALLPDLAAPALPVLAVPGVSEEPTMAAAPKRRGRGGSGGSKRPVKESAAPAVQENVVPLAAPAVLPAAQAAKAIPKAAKVKAEKKAEPQKKPAARSRQPRQPKAVAESV
jgi:uncharacterized LabA/DUF88 family protein